MHVRPGELRPVHRRRRRRHDRSRAAAPAALPGVVGRVRRVLVAVPTSAAAAAAAASAADVGRLIDPRAREDGGDLGGLLCAEHRRRRRRRGGRRLRGMVVVPRGVVVGQGVAVAVHPVEVGGGGAVVDDLQSAKMSQRDNDDRDRDAPSSFSSAEPFWLDWFRSSR